MEIGWARIALDDLEGVYGFLAAVNERAAAQRYTALVDAPLHLVSNPRFGRCVEGVHDREVRRLIIGGYELSYEVKADAIVVLQIWLVRENR